MKKLTFLLILAFAVTGCIKDTYLEFPQVTFSADAAEQTITENTGKTFYLKEIIVGGTRTEFTSPATTADWLTVEALYDGDSNRVKALKLTVEKNETGEARKADIVVSNGPQTGIPVTQLGK